MDAKLTLKLDKEVIEKAKVYAALHKKSLSRMVEAYLKSIVKDEAEAISSDTIEITPFVKSMSQTSTIPVDYKYKDDYLNYVAEKQE